MRLNLSCFRKSPLQCPPLRIRSKCTPIVFVSVLPLTLLRPIQETSQNHRYFQSPTPTPECALSHIPEVVSADDLPKNSAVHLLDPLAVVTVDEEQVYTTNTVKKTLNPIWNQSLDV